MLEDPSGHGVGGLESQGALSSGCAPELDREGKGLRKSPQAKINKNW